MTDTNAYTNIIYIRIGILFSKDLYVHKDVQEKHALYSITEFFSFLLNPFCIAIHSVPECIDAFDNRRKIVYEVSYS